MAGGKQPAQPWQQNLYPPRTVPQTVYRKERPTGVVVIAILMLIGAVLLLFMGFALFFIAFLAVGGPDGGFFGALFGILGLIMLAFGITYFILARGLLKLKPWARTITRVLVAISIAFAIPAVLAGDPISIINMILNFVIFFYLSSQDVKAAFVDQRFSTYQTPRSY